METATLTDLIRCHLGVTADPGRVGLVVDYRGDRPPLDLFELLRRYGWSTPAPHSPPASAIDWDHPDPDSGRRWSLRPFLVVSAVAVPGPAAPDWACTETWLEHTLSGCGLALSGDRVDVVSLREPRQGRVDSVLDDAAHSVDPFRPDRADVHMAPLAAIAPTPAPPGQPILPLRPSSRPASAFASPPVAAGVVEDRVAPSPVVEPVVAEPAVIPPLASPSPTAGIGRPSIDLVEAPTAPADAEVEDTVTSSVGPLEWTADDPALHQRTVCAVVRQGVIGRVFEVLAEFGVAEDAVAIPVEGNGRGGGKVLRFRGQVSYEPLTRAQFQVSVDPSSVDDLVERLVAVARMGEKGDGKIWVT